MFIKEEYSVLLCTIIVVLSVVLVEHKAGRGASEADCGMMLRWLEGAPDWSQGLLAEGGFVS